MKPVHIPVLFVVVALLLLTPEISAKRLCIGRGAKCRDTRIMMKKGKGCTQQFPDRSCRPFGFKRRCRCLPKLDFVLALEGPRWSRFYTS